MHRSRPLLALAPALACAALFGADAPTTTDVERLSAAATAARQAAAANPVVRDADSAPVKAYLLEQQRRRAARLAGLRQRLSELARDPAQAALADVLRQQLADVERQGPEPVSFDSAYGYSPSTGLLGYARKVRLLENLPDGKAVVMADNAALVLAGLGTSEYASGKFFGIEQAILVGAPRPDYVFRGVPKKSYDAVLIDLVKLLARPAAASP